MSIAYLVRNHFICQILNQKKIIYRQLFATFDSLLPHLAQIQRVQTRFGSQAHHKCRQCLLAAPKIRVYCRTWSLSWANGPIWARLFPLCRSTAGVCPLNGAQTNAVSCRQQCPLGSFAHRRTHLCNQNFGGSGLVTKCAGRSPAAV